MPVRNVTPQSTLASTLQRLKQLVLSKEKWKSIKLEPKFDVRKLRDRYVIQSYIPSMNRDDITVDTDADGETLIIKGCRMPTRKELVGLIAHLERLLLDGEMDEDRINTLSDEQILLSLGGGRYGSFVQQYRLPENADRNGVRASYNNGAVTVIIPIQEPNTPFSLDDFMGRVPTSRQFGGLPLFDNFFM